MTIDGYLVDVDWPADGQWYLLRTSKLRTDTGVDSSEFFYVDRVTIGDEVYT